MTKLTNNIPEDSIFKVDPKVVHSASDRTARVSLGSSIPGLDKEFHVDVSGLTFVLALERVLVETFTRLHHGLEVVPDEGVSTGPTPSIDSSSLSRTLSGLSHKVGRMPNILPTGLLNEYEEYIQLERLLVFSRNGDLELNPYPIDEKAREQLTEQVFRLAYDSDRSTSAAINRFQPETLVMKCGSTKLHLAVRRLLPGVPLFINVPGRSGLKIFLGLFRFCSYNNIPLQLSWDPSALFESEDFDSTSFRDTKNHYLALKDCAADISIPVPDRYKY